MIAVSLIRPNTKPPPGTETPIKGTIKMIQVENSVFLLSLRFPCPFPFLMMERVPFTVCISSTCVLLIIFHLHSLQMKCILFTKNIWRPYAIHTRIAYYLVKYHYYYHRYQRHQHHRQQPLRLLTARIISTFIIITVIIIINVITIINVNLYIIIINNNNINNILINRNIITIIINNHQQQQQ